MLKKGLWIVATLLMGASVMAQVAECPDFIYDYIEQTADVCAATGRNQICYGSNAIDVDLLESEINFSDPGDITDLVNVDSIQTSELDVATQEFGMALLQVQADVEGALPGQVVTFLLMGNVSVDGINDGDAPMQAFQFRTGIGAPTCENSNYDALMIDSPDGLVINFNVNGVDIELGSTAIIVGKPDNKIDMLVLEGHGRVTAMGETVEVEAGFWTQIPMDPETGTTAVAAPEEPVPFGTGRVIHLPLNLLHSGENIALNKPVTVNAEIADNPATNVVNGILEDAWSATDGNNSITIDLLQEFPVSEIRWFSPASDTPVSYDLSWANNSAEFGVLGHLELESSSGEWLSLVPDTTMMPAEDLLFIRYIRIELTSAEPVSLSELEVYADAFYGCLITANPANGDEGSNMRVQPNLSSGIAGTFSPDGRSLASTQARDADGMTWWQLNTGAWIRGDRVIARGSCTFLPES